jgi:hypothetical protein
MWDRKMESHILSHSFLSSQTPDSRNHRKIKAAILDLRSSLIFKRDHRIHFHGPPRRNEAGQERHDHQ